MITQTRFVRFGNILDVTDGIIMHGCNAQGVMGSGIALQIKNKYPECFKTYTKALISFARVGINPMGMIIPYYVTPKLAIFNAITQEGFGRADKRYVSYDAVLKVFEQAVNLARQQHMHVHYPQIGAGLGRGDWSIISDIIETAFQPYPDIERTLWIYEA